MKVINAPPSCMTVPPTLTEVRRKPMRNRITKPAMNAAGRLWNTPGKLISAPNWLHLEEVDERNISCDRPEAAPWDRRQSRLVRYLKSTLGSREIALAVVAG